MTYNRVTPRDLFNEAKLLKCLGKLSLNISDNICGIRQLLAEDLDDGRDQFRIHQDIVGNIHCSNYTIYFLDNMRTLYLHTPMNAEADWPLEYHNEGMTIQDRVFDDDGNMTENFLLYLVS